MLMSRANITFVFKMWPLIKLGPLQLYYTNWNFIPAE